MWTICPLFSLTFPNDAQVEQAGPLLRRDMRRHQTGGGATRSTNRLDGFPARSKTERDRPLDFASAVFDWHVCDDRIDSAQQMAFGICSSKLSE
jgi:hypothetical protein